MNSPFKSKINWTSAVTMLIGTAVTLGLIPPFLEEAVTQTALVVLPALIILFRSFYTDKSGKAVSGKKPSAPAKTGQLSTHFHEDEFRCNHCGKLHPNGVPNELVMLLEDVREHFGGKPINVNSGYRCPTHNQNVGGAKASKHMEGIAADFTVAGVSPADVYMYASKANPSGGVGRYNNFTHVDVRNGKARW